MRFHVAALIALASVPAAAQITVGAHLYTAHSDESMHDSTPGLYAVWPVGVAGGRLVTGFYRNSLNLPAGERRITVYAGQVWDTGRFTLMAGVASGYQRQMIHGRAACPGVEIGGALCTREVGFSRGALTPIVAPSVSFPEARKYLGLTPRLTLLVGKQSSALHLSVERKFGGL